CQGGPEHPARHQPRAARRHHPRRQGHIPRADHHQQGWHPPDRRQGHPPAPCHGTQEAQRLRRAGGRRYGGGHLHHRTQSQAR
ncbi:hypothetical protein BN1723_020976, partial [Verticillium longisporum]